MLKKIFLLFIILSTGIAARAQVIDSVYDRYLDFNLARFQGESDKLLQLGEAVLPNAEKLPEKTKINFYFSLGKVYEDNDMPDKALIYYEKVAAAVPDYYVVHRGLGYIYLEKSKQLKNQLYNTTDAALKQKLTDEYTAAARKALPHLEKAQACDPSDETLDEIKSLYTNLKDTEGLKTLDTRLKELSKHCIDILEDK